jgi:hypothetical protein
MPKSLRLSFVALLLLAPSLRLAAFGAAGAAAAPYIKMPMGARGTAMGEAFSGLADDVSALYYNPAGLTSMEAAQLQLMHLEGFGGVRYENLGLAVPAELVGLDVWGTIGFSYTLVAIDDIPRTRILPGTADTFDTAYADRGFQFTSGASVVTASYAWQATKLYSIGATFKAINEKVDTVSGWGLAADIGLLSRPEVIKGLSAGMTLQNVGTSPSKNASLPMSLRIGLGQTWNYPFTPDTWDDRLIVGGDIVMPIVPVDGVWHLNLGTEYLRWFGNQFGALRMGLRYPSDLGALSMLTLGGGLGTQLPGADLSFDYAWVPYGDLGSMHRFALNAIFGSKPRPRPKGGVGGFYLYAPPNVQGSATGDRQARITWEAQKGRVDGYNLYMCYNPAEGKWIKLNKTAPIVGTSQTLNGLYAGYKTYFAVTTLARKGDNLYQESERSPSVMVVPTGAAAPKAPAAAPAAKPVATPAPAKAAPAPKAQPTAPPAPPAPMGGGNEGPPKSSNLPPPPLPF